VDALESGDEHDKKMIEILKRDSRTSLREMAKLVPLSPSSIRNRLARLVKDGIIERYTIDVNYRKLGFEIQVFILLTTRPGKSDQIYRTIEEYVEVSNIYWTTGPSNLIFLAQFKDMNDLSRFMTGKIERLEGIERVETLFLMPRPKP
jgi:Lrp/AsnC family transcriptional regulator for asnA, asnC and gidA